MNYLVDNHRKKLGRELPRPSDEYFVRLRLEAERNTDGERVTIVAIGSDIVLIVQFGVLVRRNEADARTERIARPDRPDVELRIAGDVPIESSTSPACTWALTAQGPEP